MLLASISRSASGDKAGDIKEPALVKLNCSLRGRRAAIIYFTIHDTMELDLTTNTRRRLGAREH